MINGRGKPLKAQVSAAADDILFYFCRKIRLDVLYESYTRQTIHIKCQVLFSLNNNNKNNNNNNNKIEWYLLELCLAFLGLNERVNGHRDEWKHRRFKRFPVAEHIRSKEHDV